MRRRLLIVPARGGSQRIARKNIKNFLGKPAILRVLSQAKLAGVFDKIHVSTEDTEIFEIVSQAGYKPDFPRSFELAGHDIPVADVVEFVVEEYQRRDNFFDTIVLAFPTAFMTTAKIFVDAIETFEDLPAASQLISVSRFAVPIEWAYDMASDGELKARQPEKLTHRSQDLRKTFHETGQFVIYDTLSVFRSNGTNRKFGFDAGGLSIDIDDEDDWNLAEQILS